MSLKQGSKLEAELLWIRLCVHVSGYEAIGLELMTDERIYILRDILLELHNGASPESVQERFDATFTGVSAIEISMEHELMNSDSGVNFECH